MGSKCSMTGEYIKDYITGRDVMDSDDERIRQFIERLLVEEKGYKPEEIVVDRYFVLHIDGEVHQAVAELVVFINEKPFMSIKSSRGSLVTREQEAIAASRLAYETQTPLTVVTNGEDAELLNSYTGKVIGAGLNAIPSREEAIEMADNLEYLVMPPKQREKWTRIYMAYTTFECSNFCS